MCYLEIYKLQTIVQQNNRQLRNNFELFGVEDSNMGSPCYTLRTSSACEQQC